MERYDMTVRTRKELGKGPSRRLRSSGLVPGVVYSPRMDPVAISFKPLDLRPVLTSDENVIVNMTIDNDGENFKKLVMIKDFTLHPIKNVLSHVDFYEISMDEEITLDVQIVLTGEAEGVVMGGTLNQILRSVEVSCLPGNVPDAFEVDCTPLKIGQSILVSDLEIAEGVQMLVSPDMAIVAVMPPGGGIDEEEEEGEEEAAEGEAASEEAEAEEE